MPAVSLTLPDVDQSVERPSILDIIDQIKKVIKITDQARIFFPGEIRINPTAKSNINEEQDRRAIFGGDRYLYVEIESDYDEDSLATTAIHHREHIPVFLDQEVDVAIWPIYLNTRYSINFKYFTVSKTEAIRWRDDIRARITQMRDTNLHDITYHYQLPNELWELVSQVYKQKKRLLGDDFTLIDYVKEHASNRLVLLGDLTNKNQALGVAETQTRIIGQFDFSPLPEKIERDDNTGGWICTFSYKFSFEKPALAGCRYPLMIYNEMLPAKYLTFVSEQRKDDQKKSLARPRSLSALSHFEVTQQLEQSVNIYVPYQIPEFDELKARSGPHGYGPMLSILVEINEEDNRGLFNIKDLDPYMIDEDILQFIQESEYPYIHHAYHSVLNIGLWENKSHKADRAIQCSRDLDLSAVIDLNPKKMYHVVFSLLVDLPYLKQEAIDRLRKYPKAFVKIIQAMNETLRDYPELQVLARKPYITKTDFNQFFRFLVGYNTKRFAGPNNLYQNPPTSLELTELDQYGRPLQTRRTRPTVQGPNHPLDPIQPYRGKIFERARMNSVTFKQSQLSSIIAIHRQL